ncbi:MAG: phosphatidylglycerophosphatase A family protein, partial [Alphaproteobacteria bacterium]
MAALDPRIRLVATFFGAGTFPFASGTFGSMAALPFGALILQIPPPFGRLALLIAVCAALALGIWASTRYEQAAGRADPGEIVIDEVAGQWLALVFASPDNPWHFLAAFLLFRFFDIAKLWPANWAQDQLPGGWGVMMDDIVADLYAAAALYAGIWAAELPYVARN